MSNFLSLSLLVQKKIAYRIFIFFLIMSSLLIALTSYDLVKIFENMDENLEKTTYQLSEFVISQALIGNKKGIQLAIERYKKVHKEKISWVENKEAPESHFHWKLPFSWKYTYPVRSLDKRNFGALEISGNLLTDKGFVKDFIVRMVFLLFSVFFMIFLLMPLSKKIPHELFISPINYLLNMFKKDLQENVSREASSEKIADYSQKNMGIEINDIAHNILELIEIAKKDSETKAMYLLSERVVHDIRSPLSVLNMTLLDLKKIIPSKEYELLDEAICGVQDVANNLLSRYRQASNDHYLDTFPQSDDIAARPMLFSFLIEKIISQKKQEWKENSCNLSLIIDSDAQYAWAMLSPNHLKSMLSNLLNNAYESLKNLRNIEVVLKREKNKLSLEIKDSGCGIPKENQGLVLFGKSSKHTGKGIGLSSAVSYMKSIDGELILTSELNMGTTVTLLFALLEKPVWFPDKIVVKLNDIVVILDDSPSIHALLRRRFLVENVRTAHFNQWSLFNDWDQKNTMENKIYLIDYDFADNNKNGIDVLKSINPKYGRYLVTNYAEDFLVQQLCFQNGIALIPKNLLNVIKIAH